MMVCSLCRVRGRVQGVFYRASCQRRAHELGVEGWAINMPDGSVEVMACGEEETVKDLCQWLWEGPPHSDVSHVECEQRSYRKIDGFRTG